MYGSTDENILTKTENYTTKDKETYPSLVRIDELLCKMCTLVEEKMVEFHPC